MKITIRRNCFETNSSSSHTITIVNKPKIIFNNFYLYDICYNEDRNVLLKTPTELVGYLISVLICLENSMHYNKIRLDSDIVFPKPYTYNNKSHIMVYEFIKRMESWGYKVYGIDEYINNENNVNGLSILIDSNYDVLDLLAITHDKKIFEQFLSETIIDLMN